MSPRIAAVLFDLDGTLLDTASDMVPALNQLRIEQGQEPLPFDLVRAQVSHGSAGMLKLAFPGVVGDPLEALRSRLFELYIARIATTTRPFPGFEAVLDELERRGLRWGVVTNKPGFLAVPLLEALDLGKRAGIVVSGDTLPQRKPHPAPLLHAARSLDLDPATCLYVGDAERDVQSARAAGMPVLVARFGYLGPDDDPDAWAPDAHIDQPAGLLQWLDAR